MPNEWTRIDRKNRSVVPIVGRLGVISKSWSGENHQAKEQVDIVLASMQKTFLMAQNKKNGYLFILVAVRVRVKRSKMVHFVSRIDREGRSTVSSSLFNIKKKNLKKVHIFNYYFY
jgi:hypothetical protein